MNFKGREKTKFFIKSLLKDINLVLVPKQEFLNKLLQNSFTHGAQVGAMFAAAIKLGWLKP